MRLSSLLASALILAGACASPAEIPTVELGPDPADTRDDLIASVEGSTDFRIDWFVDDVAVPEIEGDTVPASQTLRGQVWRAEVTSFGEKDTASASDSLTLRNARPEVRLSLAPEAPAAGDALVVAAVPLDADGDPLEMVIRWSRDGTVVKGMTSEQVPADTTRRGETWTVEVEASDGSAWSEPATASVNITNGLPELLDGGIRPAAPTASDTISLWFDASDPDGDPIIARIAWFVDGTKVQEGESPRLLPGPFDKGSVVSAQIVLGDALSPSGGDPQTVGSVTIGNRPPTRPISQIVPERPVSGDALRCDVKAPATDPDGDGIVAYRATWTVDGEVFSDNRDVEIEGDLVPRGTTLGEQQWRCALQAFDGEHWSSAHVSTVEVAWDGFRASQTLGGRTITCSSVATTADHTTCTGLRVQGQAFPNGLSCSLGWSSTPSPHTDHAGFCALLTGERAFLADYTCSSSATRATWNAGSWGSRVDNGLTQSLRCFFSD